MDFRGLWEWLAAEDGQFVPRIPNPLSGFGRTAKNVGGDIARGFRRTTRGGRQKPAASGEFSGSIRPGSVQVLGRGPGGSIPSQNPPTGRAAAIAALAGRQGVFGVGERPDGLIQVDLGPDGVLLYDIDETGNTIQVDDPAKAGGGSGFGNALALRDQQLQEADFIREVLSSGRDFLTAAQLTRGFRAQRAPITQADLIAGVGGGGSLPSISNLSGTPGFGTGETPGADGAAPAGGGFSPLRTQADIVALSQEAAPPAVRNTLEGRPIPGFRTNVPLPSPTTLDELTTDEEGALNTALLAEQGITAEELAEQSQRRFLGGRNARTGSFG